MRDYHGLFRWVQCNHKVCKMKEGGREELSLPLLALKAATSQGVWAASRRWENAKK